MSTLQIKWVIYIIVGMALVSTGQAEDINTYIEDVYTVQPDILAVSLIDGKIIRGKKEPYIKKEGDTVDSPDWEKWIHRDGKIIGAAVGPDSSKIKYLDDFKPGIIEKTYKQVGFIILNAKKIYKVTSKDDIKFSSGIQPEEVFRKGKPIDQARIDGWKFGWPIRHVVYLKLPESLTKGKTYTVSFGNLKLPEYKFKYTPESIRSEAVHISHIGFRPDDSAKVAFLSCWMGDGKGIKYDNSLPFQVLNHKTGRKVYSGTTSIIKSEMEGEDIRGKDYTKANTYLMDFSDFSTEGEYRVYVEGVGCSYPFKIDKNAWYDAFYIAQRGFYHQRSGIELGPPYTDFTRPRNMHPRDGVKIYRTTFNVMESKDQGDSFKQLVKNKTDEVVTNAWGGYHDAGDWDRRTPHLRATQLQMELYEMFPEYLSKINFNIPESDNNIPDFLDECRWNIDCYLRMQMPDGGIPHGIESAEHPKYGEGSWEESLTIMVFAPDAESTYQYAASAARMAFLLKDIDADKSAIYRKSAIKAFNWGETVYGKYKDSKSVYDHRNHTALQLYRVTGKEKWHKIFLDTTILKIEDDELFRWQWHDQTYASIAYLMMEGNSIDKGLQKEAKKRLLHHANLALGGINRTGFRWTKRNPWAFFGWGVPATDQGNIDMCRAHYFTGKPKFLKGAVLAAQYGAGANPDNMTYTTGVGHKSPLHPLWCDSHVENKLPPPGIPLYGPLDAEHHSDYWTVKLIQETSLMFPDPGEWPSAETFIDIFFYPAVTEFTVNQTMGPNVYGWGYLAARNQD